MKPSRIQKGIPRWTDLELRATSGPTAVSFRLIPPGPATVGRRSASTLQLNDPAVSRDHATFFFREGQGSGGGGGAWLLEDLGSTQGTWLNGVRLKPDRQYELCAKDLLVIGPWTLLVVDRGVSASPGTTMATVNDTALSATVVARLEPTQDGGVAYDGLQLLQECSERIHAARTQAALIEAVLDAATAATDFSGAAFLRPVANDEEVEVVAFRGDDPAAGQAPGLSRKLIREAAHGAPARLLASGDGVLAASSQTAEAQTTALCAPIMVESTLAGFIYLDGRSGAAQGHGSQEASEAFVLALGRLAGLGMANLMRIEVEQRQARMEAKLHAVTEAQRWLLPERTGMAGAFTYIGETRQGRYLGGDFFDVFSLKNERLAVVVGDVRGMGVPISVLVSASLGFLQASLLEHEDPRLAVEAINHFYRDRISNSRSLRLWVGIFDAKKKTATYVDAGHRYAMSIAEDGTCTRLPSDEQSAAGTQADARYPVRIAALAASGRILILSHGLINQRSRKPRIEEEDVAGGCQTKETSSRFGVDGVEACMKRAAIDDDAVAALLTALERHAGTDTLDDDATAVMIRW